ncbi:hypothetical protein [Novipirellula artificiosorum]|uniref:Uncharacterized protein n=1 Tax=Novipirellula artificiosorum TaxID=2528016 RepID=A0A5C6DL62_9BACT|nr:hypothetical protein [Novipirellula artificiosorum]TWU37342.1 hypothetical protein Poly41_34720 [Novipirellula artificiosorum]
MPILIRFTVALLVLLHAILPVNDGVALPQIERLRGIEHIGVRVRQNGTTTDIYMNLEADGSIRHRNANLEMPNGWETDAYLFAFTYPEGADPNNPASTRLNHQPVQLPYDSRQQVVTVRINQR